MPADQKNKKSSEGAFDYGYCCGGGGVDPSKYGVVGWRSLELGDLDPTGRSNDLPLRRATGDAAAADVLIRAGLAANPSPRPLHCMTLPAKRYTCSSMYITPNVFEYVTPAAGEEPERTLASKDSAFYKDFLRYSTCLGHMKYRAVKKSQENSGKAPSTGSKSSTPTSKASAEKSKFILKEKTSNCGARELYAGTGEATWKEIVVDVQSPYSYRHSP